MYDDIREALVEEAKTVNPSFDLFSDHETFVFYMSNHEMAKYTAKACRQIFDRLRNFVMK